MALGELVPGSVVVGDVADVDREVPVLPFHPPGQVHLGVTAPSGVSEQQDPHGLGLGSGQGSRAEPMWSDPHAVRRHQVLGDGHRRQRRQRGLPRVLREDRDRNPGPGRIPVGHPVPGRIGRTGLGHPQDGGAAVRHVLNVGEADVRRRGGRNSYRVHRLGIAGAARSRDPGQEDGEDVDAGSAPDPACLAEPCQRHARPYARKARFPPMSARKTGPVPAQRRGDAIVYDSGRSAGPLRVETAG